MDRPPGPPGAVPRASTSDEKILWTATNVGTRTVGLQHTLAVGSATWADQGRPWAFFETEDVRYDVDVREYLRARGI